MARRAKPNKGPAWPAWFYGPDGASGIFHSEEEVPAEWARKPDATEIAIVATPTVELNRDELIAELTERGIDINPIWGNAHLKRIIDGDVSPPR